MENSDGSTDNQESEKEHDSLCDDSLRCCLCVRISFEGEDMSDDDLMTSLKVVTSTKWASRITILFCALFFIKKVHLQSAYWHFNAVLLHLYCWKAFVAAVEKFYEAGFICSFKYVRQQKNKCQLLNFVLPQAKMVVCGSWKEALNVDVESISLSLSFSLTVCVRESESH